MLSGVIAFLLGLMFLLVGIAVHLRAQKGNGPLERTLPPSTWFSHFPNIKDMRLGRLIMHLRITGKFFLKPETSEG